MMKRKVSRVEAIIIMRAAREFREKQHDLLKRQSDEVLIVRPLPVVDIPPEKKGFFSYIIDFFRKRGT